jgi:hypothetical protein
MFTYSLSVFHEIQPSPPQFNILTNHVLGSEELLRDSDLSEY